MGEHLHRHAADHECGEAFASVRCPGDQVAAALRGCVDDGLRGFVVGHLGRIAIEAMRSGPCTRIRQDPVCHLLAVPVIFFARRFQLIDIRGKDMGRFDDGQDRCLGADLLCKGKRLFKRIGWKAANLRSG